jgi:Domain of unknown function (DUF5666)
MKSRPMFERWRATVSVVCSLAVLLSCGGGVDSGGTGAPVTLASGPVSGLGSVTVNGVRFDDDSASIVDQDDIALTTDQLQVGMSARIDASAVVSGSQPMATALTIRTNSEIIGPVDSVGPFGATMVVLGQSVRLTVATWLDNALTGGIGTVTAGQVVEVWGQYNSRTNEYVATRIAPRSNLAFYEIRGLLAAVDPVAQRLTVGGLTISDASIAAGALPTLSVGRFVRVTLAPAPIGNVWNALTVAPGNALLADRPDVSVLGRISNWTSSAQFILDGISVDASAATFPAGATGVVLGARVVVAGTTGGGVLKASTVTVVGDETLANSTFEVHGIITSLDPAAGKLKVRGITVNYTAQVQFSGGVIGDLAIGKNIDAIGTLDSGDRISIDAQTITFR